MSHFQDYLNDIFTANTYQESFLAYNKYIEECDYKSLIYCFIPSFYLGNKNNDKPIFSMSASSNFEYLKYYEEARLDKHDNIIEKINNGCTQTIDWQEELRKNQLSKKQEKILSTMRNEYRLKNGLSIPTLSDSNGLGIAVASIVSDEEDRLFELQKRETHDELRKSTMIFHNHVTANAYEFSAFIKPFLSFSQTEKKVIKALAKGLTVAGISKDVGKTIRYTDNVILNIRKKVGGETPEGRARISTRLLIYYIGLMRLDKRI